MKPMDVMRKKTLNRLVVLITLMSFCFGQVVMADTLYYVHTDHLGTPVVITDGAQATVWKGDKSPFGETTATVNQIEFNVRFPGQYYDVESGLHYNYFRDYDPSLGRYVQSDPIGILRDYSDPSLEVAINAGALEETDSAGEVLNHLYGYVGQNPLLWYDPYGLAEHETNQRPSNREKHENANARRDRDRGGEKGDKNRQAPRKKPPGHKGPWPPPSFPILVPFPEETLRELVRPPSYVPPIPMPESC